MRDRSSLFWVGIASVIFIPLAYLDGINRFALLPQVFVLHLVALLGLVFWFRLNTWSQSPLILPVVGFLGAEALSVFQAQNIVLSMLPISTHLASIFLWLALVNGLRWEDFKRMLWVGCGVAGVLSVVGLAQFFGVADDWIPSSGLPSATFGYRNLAAAYLVGMLPFTFWVWQQVKGRWGICLWGVTFGLELAFLLATRSRAAWIGLGGALLIALGLALVRRASVQWVGVFFRTHHLGIMLAALIVCLTALTPAEVGRDWGEAMWDDKQHLTDAVVSVVKPGGDKSRLILWRHTLAMILENPVFGVGAGNWRLMYPVFAQGDLMDPRTVPERPHNDVLWIWSEMGTLGLGAYGILLWVAFALGWRLTKTEDGALGWVLICCLIGCILCSLFGFSRAFPAVWLPFWIALVGLGMSQKKTVQLSGGLRWALVVGAVGVLLGGWGVFRQIEFDRHLLAMRVAYAQNLWQQVLDESNRGLSWGVFDEGAFLMRGGAYAALGHSEQALDGYRAGLRFQPHSVGLWMGIGNVYRASGQLGSAQEAYGKALEIDPQSGEIYNNLGTMYAAIGQLDSALAVFNRALTYSPDLPALFANKSIVLRQMGHVDQALDAAGEALRRDVDHLEGLTAKGQALLEGRRFAEAAQTFSKILNLYPNQVRMHFNLAQAYEGMGMTGGAIDGYQNFLEVWKGPDLPQVRFSRRRLEALTSP